MEARVLPTVGELVELARGALIVRAHVIWSQEGRCGLKFTSSADVLQWRSAPKNSEQQRVDHVVRLAKAGAVPLPVPVPGRLGQPKGAPVGGDEVVADLRRVTELLDNLGDVLACHSDVAMRHGAVLQNLDISMQIIAALQLICAKGDDVRSGLVDLTGLRRSADQALSSR